MTSPPIPGFAAATPLETPTYWYLQISGTDQAVAIGQVLELAVIHGVIDVGTTKVNGQGWQVQVNESVAGPGDYLVIGTNPAGQLVSVALLNGPDGKYSNPLYTDKFSTPTTQGN